ncbi:TOMM precursor leader peptide-binding protein [Streptosporangium sp. NPDC000396]|uniref:TOMM precursor leader peptide-binding protein n=1 Tax=Streptosporangium sp. NPDC000396 TaxID=3366185 RepID=UPI0036A897C1
MTEEPPPPPRLAGLLAMALADLGQSWPVLDARAVLTASADPAAGAGAVGPAAPAIDAAAVASASAVPTATAPAAVVALEEWTLAQATELSAHAWQTGTILLPVRVDGSTALLGPLLHPAAPACLGCAETERLATIGGRTPRDQPGLLLGGIPAPTALPLLAALAADALADPAQWDGTVWAVRTGDGTCSIHRARPRHDGCALCGPLPDDTVEGASFAVVARPLPDPYRLRQDNPATTLDGLRRALHDWRLGPVAHVSRRESLALALAHAEVVGGWEVRDGGYGRATTFADAERIALFEAVERMAGLSPRGKRTQLRASFAELGPQRALDPARLGLHEPHLQDLPQFALSRYTPHTATTWVHGWSMGERRALAIPEQAVYWGYPMRPDHRDSAQFLLESSNGCGLGNSLEEAVLYGLLEVAERDAFLMAWYARTPLTRVEPPAEDPLVGHLVDRLDAFGYDLLLFDATNDFGVPVVASLVLCRDPESPAPQAFFAGGAHPDPREAIRAAVIEVVVNLMLVPEFTRTWPDLFDRDRLQPMLDEPHRVVTLHDHTALYTLPEARPRYAFLLDDERPARPWREVWPDRPRPTADLGGLLLDLAAQVTRAGMDVIVVDQTDPVVRADLGLHAAKVVVPGALPLTFGHVYRRTRGLSRLLEVPWRLGRLPARPNYDDLPLDPHPFP